MKDNMYTNKNDIIANADKQKEAVTRKLKYGSLSVGFAVVVVVLCIAINLAASVFSARFNLRVDITDDEARYYTVSDEAKELINEAYKDNPDWKVSLVFLTEEKKVSDTMVKELARSFESAYPDHISIEYLDMDSNYDRYKHYCTVTQVNLTQRHVLVESDTHIRALNFNSFYDDEIDTGETVGFSGLRLYTSAIVRVSMKTAPVAVFTAGHGESLDNGTILLDDLVGLTSEQIANVLITTGKNGERSPIPLFDSVVEMGYDIQVVDLNKTNALPENTKIVIINDPINDFLGYDFNNPDLLSEMEIIRNYMEDYDASLMVSIDPDTEELPELSAYLEQDFGLGYDAHVTVLDMDRSIKGSNGATLLGDLPANRGGTLGDSILSSFNGKERFVFHNPVKLTVSKSADKQGEDVLVNSSAAAVAGGMTDVYPLFAYTTHSRILENAEGKDVTRLEYQTAYLIGSTEFLSSSFLTASYSNRALFESLLRRVATEQVPIVIEPISFVTESLEITTGEARVWTIIVTLFAPAVIFGVATVVWIRRRHA